MCVGALGNLFSGRQQRLAQITALTAQGDASAAAAQAYTPVQDSEADRQAAEARLRRLTGRRSISSTFGAGELGDAPVATRQLLGA